MNTSGRKTVKATRTSAPRSRKAKATDHRIATKPTHEEIAKRSYELYLARGATDGHDVEDWVQAETELSQ
jgi:hypothetical protein